MSCRLYILNYELNSVEDVNTVFWKFKFWHHYELIGSGQVSLLLVICGSGRVGSRKMDP